MDGTVENGSQEARVDVMEQEKPLLSNHGHLLMSGPLGICDDPYCTICPSYFTSSSVSVSLTPSTKNTFFSGAKTMHGRLVGWSKYRFPVMNPHSKTVKQWNKFFVISCLFAIFVDPLFFLLFSVVETNFCIIFNDKLATSVTILRSLTDFIYLLHMLLQIITWILVRRLNAGESNANFLKDLLRATVLLQYIPRCIRFVPLALGSFAFETARANFVINLFIYLLAAHVVGCSWYLFALQRIHQCLRGLCHNERECQLAFLDCGNGKNIGSNLSPQHIEWLNTTQASSNCFVQPQFNYGIYINAIPVTVETNLSTSMSTPCFGVSCN
jgi:cyclic nucleotide gated channel